jgi:sarcosine oxidase subunit alpha
VSRLPRGGRIDRNQPLDFTFNGQPLTGCAGDTLASALLANDVRVVARSIMHDRPRGVFSAGIEEPNALVQIGSETMLRATQVELHDGLAATGLNGKGRAIAGTDAGRFDKVYAHSEVLVIGGGGAGLRAALEAGRRGDRVILMDEQQEFGGRLLNAEDDAWARSTVAELAAMPEVRCLTRTTAFGYYDQNLVLGAERRREGERLWQVRARNVVIATGAHERPLVFANNDRPGIMLAGAVSTYLHRYGVAPGRHAVIFTNNDSTDTLAAHLRAAGITVAAVVDLRRGGPITDTEGGSQGLTAVRVGSDWIPCDLLCVSGGFNPTVHLFSQAQGRLRFDEGLACFLPDGTRPGVEVIGRAAGDFELDIKPVWLVPGDNEDWSHHFIDLERDATVADLGQAVGRGMRSVEHIKRYTTIGTGSDQGKTAGINETAIIGTLTGQPIGGVGTTTYRPPYVPVSFSLWAGRNRGELFDPIRVTPIHSWHVAHGAIFEDVGQWKRPWYFPLAGEDMATAVRRECQQAREGVGVMDVSTLGKIDIQGPDALTFLNRIYTNAFDTLPVGMCRYGLMCRADGMVFDDGVVMHLGENHYLATTTSGGAAAVLDWFEEWLQTEWPQLEVRFTSVTDHWAAIAVVGPRSREVLANLFFGVPLDAPRFPFLAIREGETQGVPVRLHRITFSGELAYELWAPGWYGLALWEAVMAAGAPFGISPYGTEAMHVLRAEKGYIIIGQETDGTITPQDLGMDWIVSKKKDFVGKRSFLRSDTARKDRKHLVGLLPVEHDELLPEGAQLTLTAEPSEPVPMVGHVTSSYRSATLGRTFALALVRSGRERIGDTVYAPLPDRTIAATITEPIFWDRENRRRDS